MQRATHRACRVLALMIVLLMLGCESSPRADIAARDIALPNYADLAGRHNTRVEMLSRLYSRGVLEVEWHYEDGTRRREHQVDLDFYLMPDRRTAFRASKVADIYLWFGSDSEQYWIFDLTGDEKRLYVAPHEHAADRSSDISAFQPLLLLDLMGLVRLPAPERDSPPPPMKYSEQHDAWAILTNATPPGWRVLLFLDRETLLPKRAEAVTMDGEVVYTSTIGRYRRAWQDGMASVRFPQMPTMIDIVAQQPVEDVDRIEVKFAFGSPTGRVDDQPMDRVFDLERLKTALRPDRIESP